MFPLRDVNPTQIRPVVTMAIVLVNVAIFFAWQPSPADPEHVEFLYARAAVPCEIVNLRPVTVPEIQAGECQPEPPTTAALVPEKHIPLSLLVSLFLHGGLLHLAGNMWFLWVFGNNVEEAFGHAGYAVVYLLAGVLATLAFVGLHPDTATPLIGASGAIAGVLGAYFILYPKHWVISWVVITILPVPAVIFLGFWFLAQFLMDAPGVAWEAHVAGFVVGMGVALLLRGWLLGRVERLHARTGWR